MADRKYAFGAEGSWATSATTWRRFDVETDDHKVNTVARNYRGIGSGGGRRASGRTLASRGGAGTIKAPAYSNGLGLLHRAAATTFSHDVVDGGTLAFEQIAEFGFASGPPTGRSITTVAYRDRADGTLDAWRFRGGVPKSVQLDIEMSDEGFAMFTWDMGYKLAERESPVPSRTIVQVDPDTIFSGDSGSGGLVLTRLSDDEEFTDCIKKLSLVMPLALDHDDRCIGGLQHFPTRSGIVEPTISIEWKYQDPRPFDSYVNNEAFSLALTLTGPDAIEASTYPSLLAEVPCFAYEQNDPEMPVDGPTMQTMPGTVLDDGNGVAMRITQITSDSAF